MAYVGLRRGKNQIYVRALMDAHPRPLDGTDGGASPFFPPDGQWIGFFADNKLKKIAVGGGALPTLADAKHERGARGPVPKKDRQRHPLESDPTANASCAFSKMQPEKPITRIDVVLNWFAEF